MAGTGAPAQVGTMLREWRERRRLTQLELALDAGTSARHLSFVETGRSRPGRQLLLRVLEQLEVPFRERNDLLLVAGHAPAFPERPLDDPELAPVREALDQVLAGHEPYPAIAVDRAWNLVAANSAVARLIAGVEIHPDLLAPPVNAVRASLHPRGLSPLIVNVAGWRAFFRDRLERQFALTRDARLAALMQEIAGYPEPPPEPDHGPGPAGDALLGPLRIRAPGGGELRFFGMFGTFDTPFEVTMSELAVELLFPADGATAEALEALARPRAG